MFGYTCGTTSGVELYGGTTGSTTTCGVELFCAGGVELNGGSTRSAGWTTIGGEGFSTGFCAATTTAGCENRDCNFVRNAVKSCFAVACKCANSSLMSCSSCAMDIMLVLLG